MNDEADHHKVGGESGDASAELQLSEADSFAKIADFFEAENARQRNYEKMLGESYEHSQRTIHQYHILRWIGGFCAIIAPPLVLGFLFFGARELLSSLHAAAQALFVSGAFISFIVLYGVLLRELFHHTKEKLEALNRPLSESEKETERRRNELIPEHMELIKRVKNTLPPENG